MKLLFGLFSVILLFSCAHHRDVRPGPAGVHRISLNADDKDEGVREAILQASHFCKEQGKYLAIVTEEKKYIGDMDEEGYRMTKKVADVARVFGGHLSSVQSSAYAADTMRGKGYEVTLTFKCQ